TPGYKLEIANCTIALNVSSLLYANASGVGIGNSSFSELLTLYSSSSPGIRIENGKSGLAEPNDTIGKFEFWTNDGSATGKGRAAHIIATTARTGGSMDTGSELIFGTRAGGSNINDSTDRVIIDRNGNVG